jgi:hypothetical protein
MRSGAGTRGGATVRDGLAGVGVVVFAVACCGALPLAAGALGGLALGAWLGIGAGLLAVVAGGVAFAAARRRRRCEIEPARALESARADDGDLARRG